MIQKLLEAQGLAAGCQKGLTGDTCNTGFSRGFTGNMGLSPEVMGNMFVSVDLVVVPRICRL